MTRLDQQHMALLEKLFVAQLSPIRDDNHEIKSLLENIKNTASNAHRRIDAWENRAWGIGAALSAIGGGIGVAINKIIPAIIN